MSEKIGLFFGSFDPPHLGHLKTAERRRDEFALDRVYMLPIPVSAIKKNDGQLRAQFNDKYMMCQKLAEGHEDWLTVKDICRDYSTGVVDEFRDVKNTIWWFMEEHPDADIHLVAGEDLRRAFQAGIGIMAASKHVANTIAKGTTPFNIEYCKNLSERIERACKILDRVSLDRLSRSTLENGEEISSTRIRNALRDQEPTVPGMPQQVVDYIYEHNLYTDHNKTGEDHTPTASRDVSHIDFE